ncbi:hypothetical protein BJ166DRAFT_600519 [Pestalotiopsis sp. NC0098]|nr:hypothetical protein BJ166DRAFT_600519 [Pestalotiopsis sp. NC0098]
MATDTRGPQVAAVTYVFLIMSTIATVLRVYCRGRVIKAFAMDDWLAVAAQFFFIVFCAYEITGFIYGTGQHNSNLSAEQLPKAMQMWWTCEPLYVLCNMSIKASIAIFLLRICVAKIHRIIIWIVIGVTELYSFAFFMLFVLQCRPTSLFWLRFSSNPPSGTCLDPSVVTNAFYGYSAISCVTDWTYSIMPIFLVWSLQMDRKVKISVAAILAAGVIASSATIVRFPYLHFLNDTDDFLYSTSDIAMWSTIETGLGITAAGVATLRPLLKTFFGGSSAPGHGTSARQWQRTGSGHPKGDEGFDMHDRGNKGVGVTTVIDYGRARAKRDVESHGIKGDADSGRSDPFSDENFNNSQANLTGIPEQDGTGWNGITVKKSIVQTSGDA